MSQLNASIRLRPIRIGFLVKPTDMTSIRKVMRASMCLWGGTYNPIIPVSRTQPAIWRDPRFRSLTGRELARGYARFFEPDVYVESSPGLADQVGLAGVRDSIADELYTLAEFLEAERGKSWAEPKFGLPVTDILHDLYKAEERFVLREPGRALVVRREQNCAAAEAILGCYPTENEVAHFERDYRDVYKPEEVSWTPETWLAHFQHEGLSPRIVTAHGLDRRRSWHHEPVIFVFNPDEPCDLIDLWNLRLEPSPVLPVPLGWIDPLGDYLRDQILQHHRPLEGNDHGVMHHSTLEFSRSISEERAQLLAKTLSEDLPAGCLSVKFWRTPIWHEHRETMVSAPVRMQITAEESRIALRSHEGDERLASFRAITPSFASKYGLNAGRWVNVVSVSGHATDEVGTVIPFNTFDRRWPRLRFAGGDRTPVGTEGWVFKQRYSNWDETLKLPSMDEIVHQSLQQEGVEAQLSEPGRIAKQMLQRIGWLWNVPLLKDRETLRLLNRMAASYRVRSSDEQTVAEEFAGRTSSLVDWQRLLRDRNERELARGSIDDFTKREIIRVGIQTTCPHCEFRNWADLDAVGYELRCERCLNNYPFPQGAIASRSANFRYRVIGPFAVPDYGLGSYGALLTLHALEGIGGFARDMTFATATDLSFDGHKVEADFIAIKRNTTGDHVQQPDLIIGECKSFGEGDLIKDGDLKKLRLVCGKLPGSVVVISVLRDYFTASEAERIRRFVQWARRDDGYGRATNPVILLTGTELFASFHLYSAWEGLGEPHSKYTGYHHIKDVRALAETTQAIYLGVAAQRHWPARRAKLVVKTEKKS